MFDRQTGSMIALSLLIGSPALVLADAELSHDNTVTVLGDYQLTSTAASALGTTAPIGTETDERGWRDPWNGVDFPVRGQDQFARTGTTGTSGRTDQR
jgi:hypothetical protein